MPLASHRTRYIVLALVLTWMALMLFTRPAHGAWTAEPVEVHATTALCPAVSAIDDGHFERSAPKSCCRARAICPTACTSQRRATALAC